MKLVSQQQIVLVKKLLLIKNILIKTLIILVKDTDLI